MSGDEWMLGEAVIRHVARAFEVSPELARIELIMAAASRRVDAADRRGKPVRIAAVQPHMGFLADIELQASHQMRLEEVRFRRAQVEAEWPPPAAAKVEAPEPEAPPRSKRGRKPEFDWDAVTTELVRFADKEGLQGQSQRSMSEYLASWYAGRNGGEGPAPSTVRTRISRYLPNLPEESDD